MRLIRACSDALLSEAAVVDFDMAFVTLGLQICVVAV